MKRVAILGVGAFSGRHFERFIADQGLTGTHKFFGLTRRLNSCENTGLVDYTVGDALADGDVANFLAKTRPDYILNLIGVFRAPSLDAFIAAHVGVCRAIGEAVLASGQPVEKIVFVGSAAEYGVPTQTPVREDDPTRPTSWYGLSKLYQTELARYFFNNNGLPVVVARTFNILGEGLSPHLSIGNFSRQIDILPDGGTIKVGNLTPSRDFLDIAEVSARYWTLLEKGRPGEIYNLCSGVPQTIRSVLDGLIAASGKALNVEVDPSLLRAGDVEVIFGDSAKFDALRR